MKQKIKDIANSLEINIIGFTSKLDYSYLKDELIKRVYNSYNTEFEEQDINKRLDIRNVFPDCKSIIAIGVPYAIGYKKPRAIDKGLLSVSSYGLDYHIRLTALLHRLAEEIKRYKSFNYEVCVDTSPLLDKEICKNAGIGNYGKNSLIINEQYGSFINLGYLLTDLEIECSGSTSKDVCGDCDICIKSCPNGAILKDGKINSRRCVSYLTQTKEYIPISYRKNMSCQIYGCDVCQLVCPKNKSNSEIITNNDYKELLIDLGEIIKISNKEFVKKYKHLAGSWRGKNIWKRNSLIAISNLELNSMFDIIKNELDNPSEMIKIYTAWCLLNLNKNKALDLMNNKIKYEEDSIKLEYIKLMER